MTTMDIFIIGMAGMAVLSVAMHATTAVYDIWTKG